MEIYDKLCKATADKNWTNLVEILPPKYFLPNQKKTFMHKKILAKVAEILTSPGFDIPGNIRIHLLKCIANSCVEGYKHRKLLSSENGVESSQDVSYETYNLFAQSTVDTEEDVMFFPWDGVVSWTADYIVNSVQKGESSSEEQCKVLQYCMQFLVNFVNSACGADNYPSSLKSGNFKAAIRSLFTSNHLPLASAACLYTQNQLNKSLLPEDFYSEAELSSLAEPLIKADELGIDIASDTLILLSSKPSWLRNTYENLSIEHKLYLLEIIHQDVRNTVYSEEIREYSTKFPFEVIEFLSERFRKRSDLILKTVDSYLDGMEPAEVTLLLDIIGVISSKQSPECQVLQADKSLIINCIFLLKSLHMTGRASENHFTPLQKLSDVALSTQETQSAADGSDFQKHPAFGFKAGLIRVIGNLAHKHKINQEVLRETDAIPLLLDCCNIDARNPLIMQWTIFALRNICENSPENQEIIRNCNKVGVVDNAVLREMGLKLHEGEDGKAIGILPLPRRE